MKAIALAAAIALAGCANQQDRQPQVPPIVVDKPSLVETSSLTLAAVESGLKNYQMRHALPDRIKADLIAADAQARVAISDLNKAVAAELPYAVQRTALALKILATAIPPGVLPPEASVALLALSATAQLVAQIVPPPKPPTAEPVVSTPAELPPPLKFSPPVHPGAPAGFGT